MPGTRDREERVRDYSPDKGWRRWDREEPERDEDREERRRRREDYERRGRSPRRDRRRSPSPDSYGGGRGRWDQQNAPQRVQKNSSYLEERNRERQQSRYRSVWTRSPSPPPSYYKERKKWQKMKLQEARKEKNTQPAEDLIRDEFGRIPKDLPKEGRDSSDSEDDRSSRKKQRRNRSPSRSPSRSPPRRAKKEEESRKRKNNDDREERERERKKARKVESESESDSDSDSDEESDSSDDDQEVWIEKTPVIPARPVGPEPQQKIAAQTKVDYGGNMMKGEAEAYAQYVQEGKRIPRRGEVGVTSEEIEAFENLGFVMSGSRHKRMNAVRLRKENQVYTAEEKRAMLQLAFEEKAKKENKILADMREIVSQKLSSVDIPLEEEK
uniref:NF-kappa-B-activating protein C-terminal domain-containing protein n=1 Tax=Paramoeba aestuarina TaxID=180227 RepID=A0A7S4UBH2_9EUKA|mmetsp:Transcript_5164/g.7746  ORF Transcript_5164/g.7746 Transcript_5164/m.7746 type:complete len:384 (+) Transcript_5164:84-1235(+)